MDNRTLSLLLIVVIAGSLLFAGCESDAQRGAAAGAVAGAGVGQAIGRNSESTLIGAAVGGGAGYMLGNESDKRQAKAETARIREDMNFITVNVTNSNGSISQVRLRTQGVGYVGPRGEYYNKLPTQDQLRPVYGF
jgi:hypothetical protein